MGILKARLPQHLVCPLGSLPSASWLGSRGFNLDSCLLLCLSVVVGVIEDDYLAVTRRPEDVTVDITKKLSGDFLIAKSINNKRGGLEHWDLLRGVALLEHQ
jgi:hypothetical protein